MIKNIEYRYLLLTIFFLIIYPLGAFIYLTVHMVIVLLRFLSFKKLKSAFNNMSLLLIGKKGSGKDVTMSIMSQNQSKDIISNIKISNNVLIEQFYNVIDDKLTYDEFINNNVEDLQIEYNERFQNKNYYLSDMGVYFPSQEDSLLSKKYKHLIIFIALSRQLYNMNVVANTQAYNRAWKKIREQFDLFIRIKSNLYSKNVRSWFCIFKSMKITYFIYDNELDINTDIEKKSKNNKYKQVFIGQTDRLTCNMNYHKIQHDTLYFSKMFNK